MYRYTLHYKYIYIFFYFTTNRLLPNSPCTVQVEVSAGVLREFRLRSRREKRNFPGSGHMSDPPDIDFPNVLPAE